MRARDFVKRNVAYHDKLNPVAWSSNQLRPEVRERLLEIAQVFEQYLEIPGFKVHDIVLTGSMANYNYTKFSDFDLHVVTDYRDLQCDDLAEALYRAKKEIWNHQHDITIHGHEVELYIEDTAQPPVSAGMYSLLQDKWIKEPSYDPPTVDDGAVNAKVADLIKQITSAIETADDPQDLKRIKDKLRKMRRSGLDTEGEFGVENLAFKILRNQGFLDRLNDAYLNQQDQALSLGEDSRGDRYFTDIFPDGVLKLTDHFFFDRKEKRNIPVDRVLDMCTRAGKQRTDLLAELNDESFIIEDTDGLRIAVIKQEIRPGQSQYILKTGRQNLHVGYKQQIIRLR
jgi:predicted nucleotidyltransferase